MLDALIAVVAPANPMIGIVIDDQKLEALVALGKYGINGSLDHESPVPCGHYDRDKEFLG
jgi:hypothetical protein